MKENCDVLIPCQFGRVVLHGFVASRSGQRRPDTADLQKAELTQTDEEGCVFHAVPSPGHYSALVE